jgi:hypothetical protein
MKGRRLASAAGRSAPRDGQDTSSGAEPRRIPRGFGRQAWPERRHEVFDRMNLSFLALRVSNPHEATRFVPREVMAWSSTSPGLQPIKTAASQTP